MSCALFLHSRLVPCLIPCLLPDLDIIHAELRAKDIEWCQKIIEGFKKMRQAGAQLCCRGLICGLVEAGRAAEWVLKDCWALNPMLQVELGMNAGGHGI